MAVSMIVCKPIDGENDYVEFAGKTGDTKPVGNYVTGSKYFDIQTGKTYYYDAAGSSGSEWIDPSA